jgi:hypothetical protein
MTGGGTVVGKGAEIVMTEMAISTGEDQGRDPEIATRNTSARTDTARAQGNTGGIDRVVKSVGVTRTTTEDHGTTIAITRERRAQSVRKGAAPTAVEAGRGRHTSIQDHAESGDKQSIITVTMESEGFEHFQINPAAVPPTA